MRRDFGKTSESNLKSATPTFHIKWILNPNNAGFFEGSFSLMGEGEGGGGSI